MGVSTDAILCYGFRLTDVDGEEEDYEPEWLEELFGDIDPISDLEKATGLTIVSHCSSESTMMILAVKESVHEANRGDPIELGQAIASKNEWCEKIRLFCKVHEIPFTEPQFILCSYCGGGGF
jgi:hypothetical protein